MESLKAWHRRLLGGGAMALCLSAMAVGPTRAHAAGAPIVGDIWSSHVDARSAVLSAEIDPNGNLTSAYFEYATKAAYEASGFTGAKKVNFNNLGSGTGTIVVHFPAITGLSPDTAYHYRLTAFNGGGTKVEPASAPYPYFITRALGGGRTLADARGWEMVSPVQKNGGQVDPPETLAGGGVIQAAAQGGQITYSSAASFEGGGGAPPASQYIATRGSGGWATQNIATPIFSGSYDTHQGGAPYRLFSEDLARGLLLNGKSCRGEATEGCPVPNPPLPGTDAPAGYQDYYLRSTLSGSFETLLGGAEASLSGQSASEFELTLAGTSPDLTRVVLSSCSRLTASATDGCPGQANLYERSAGVGALKLLNGAPGATLAAQGAGAVSEDGVRAYLYEGGDLYLRDGSALKQVDADAGGGGTFQLASSDGSVAYFTRDGDIWRYDSSSDTATRLTSTADAQGVLGAAADGSHLYYLRATGLYLCAASDSGSANGCDVATEIAAGADAGNYPPATGTSRVSSDGTKLLFVSTVPLEDHEGHTYDNTDLVSGELDSQLYLYDMGTGLACISCDPTNERPIGPSSIPGAIANGKGPSAITSYKPRVLADGGRRIYFDSADALDLADVNAQAGSGAGIADAYQWEAQGEGSCTRQGGCLSLISSGRDPVPSTFADASSAGQDAYFLTAASLIGADPGGRDLYDARVGGGFGEPAEPIACEGDACQALTPEPTDPTLTTLLSGAGNPPPTYTNYRHVKKPHKKKHHRHRKHRGHRHHKHGGRS